ncbi:hypothetical protein CLAIMM_06047 [Cladophialophora immunda]|nr:hypothetical protein CLAIMM_06047 [Cladophialophora immunda]
MADSIELPDGRMICSAHKLTVCHKCCVDYSFMEEILGEDDDDDDDKEESDGAEQLPDGRMICSAHKLTVCYKCCVDYSFMDEILDDEDDEDKEESDGDELLTEEEMKAFRERMIAKKGEGILASPNLGIYRTD